MPQQSENTVSYVIKYDGLVLGEHTIDLASLGESLQGFAKILATAGHFIATGQFARQYSQQSVKVTTDANLEKGSIDVVAYISGITASPLFIGCSSTAFGAVVTYLFNRKDKIEMEHLSNALEKALEQNKELAENAQNMSIRLVDTINRMADGLLSARRQALSPVGKTCSRVVVGERDKTNLVSIDAEKKRALEQDTEEKVCAVSKYEGILTELDKETGNCKLSVETGERIPGLISDPSLKLRSNVYIRSFAEDLIICVTAKAQIGRDGEVSKLFISDASLSETEIE